MSAPDEATPPPGSDGGPRAAGRPDGAGDPAEGRAEGAAEGGASGPIRTSPPGGLRPAAADGLAEGDGSKDDAGASMGDVAPGSGGASAGSERPGAAGGYDPGGPPATAVTAGGEDARRQRAGGDPECPPRGAAPSDGWRTTPGGGDPAIVEHPAPDRPGPGSSDDAAEGRIEALARLMARLPGFGPRSARRAVLHLVTRRDQLMGPLADAMREVARTARECAACGNVTVSDLCAICRDPRRATGEICVVEDVSALWAMERAMVFRGRYHVLGGTLSALDSVGPEELRIPALVRRVSEEEVREVILALGATIDGQTTAHYIAEALEGRAAVTSLAQGVPMGGELDYLDDGTITAALRARRAL